MSSPTLFRSVRRAPRGELLGVVPLVVFWLLGGSLLGEYLGHGSHPAHDPLRRPELESKIRGVLATVGR